jgi:4-hydroxy-3-polyprenylbenzoate decarboxylase
MAYSGLKSFIADLEKKGELIRITAFADPVLEITEIADRITKAAGPALLFENNGTRFPLLINAFGSDKRMSLAIGRENLDAAGKEIEELFRKLTGASSGSFISKISGLPGLIKVSGLIPSRSKRKGRCQQVILNDPDLGILPVLKCWPFDGGRFITLPVVHTYHPETGKANAGMYRMQVLDKNTTAMHWQMHKTGANHFEAWKKRGEIMPVSVVLGGDPVYTYAATAPLPENIDEYILAGFLRGKGVRMVKCITNNIYVPADADFVIEGFVDPSEAPFWEGPFGDHTGFYSLADWYPKFHVTCITHAADAVYPATIVGIPPQEDAFLAKATEKIFLSPIKLTLQPEIVDLHMPDPGIAHNLAVVKIRKSYPGQGLKVINSLLGAGQMMFTKYMVVVSGDVDIRNYNSLMDTIIANTSFRDDIMFTRGPLDVLDHSSDMFAFGGKMGIDATVKTTGERQTLQVPDYNIGEVAKALQALSVDKIITSHKIYSTGNQAGLLVISTNLSTIAGNIRLLSERLKNNLSLSCFSLIVVVDQSVDVNDPFMVAWQTLGNSDPVRDHDYIFVSTLLIDGTIKLYRSGGFPRKWPNIVCSDDETIRVVDSKWPELGMGEQLKSPSHRYSVLKRDGRDEITI